MLATPPKRTYFYFRPLSMKSLHFLQIELTALYQPAILCCVTAFVISLIAMPPLISVVKKHSLLDLPNPRKEHSSPVPTLGGLAVLAGMMVSLMLWFPFVRSTQQVCFFLSVVVLAALGIMDDLKNLSAKYKLSVQTGVALLVAVSGIRIQSLEGLFGIHELSISAQYTLTVLVIVTVVNAFNLIDGIDGLAGGLAFMSLIALGFFLTLAGDSNTALIAFALAGAVTAFLYFNFNPARIFMGDTGSMLLGFVIAVLSIRLVQVNLFAVKPVLASAPLFALGLVLIPVFDTARVFAIRIWFGRSPFTADRSHLHHRLTGAGYTHGFVARLLGFFHAFIMIESLWLQWIRPEWLLLVFIVLMFTITAVVEQLSRLRNTRSRWVLGNS